MSQNSSAANQPLRILMAAGVPSRREGGVAVMMYKLSEGLERRGHKVSLLFTDDLVKPGSVSSRFADLIFSHRLSRHIHKHAADYSLVDLHAPVGFPYGLRRTFFRAPQDPPYVMTLHGLEERRIEVMRREVKKGRAWHYSWKNRLWHRCYIYPRFRWCIRLADGAHTVARDTWNILQLKYGMDPDRTACIHNGVDPRFFISRSYDDSGPLKLLYVGTWLDQRGIFYIRDALRSLAPQLPGLTMTFAGCSAPPEEIHAFFGPELASTIRVLPVAPYDKMQELYAAHDAFLFPSLMEGLPSVLLEAMASGMPVITTETCGMPDVVQHGVNGLLVLPADAVGIEAAVKSLAASTELRRKLGTAAQQSMSYFTWDRAVSELEALYSRVLARERTA